MENGSRIVFKNTDDSVVTGYRIGTSNKFFYVDLDTKPSVTIKPSTTLQNKVKELSYHKSSQVSQGRS
ncbi:hypothetical protein [Ruminococcus sp.]|uniref:hypothetical protein n=1 Tax=Ruminococcus sp. TaxID=41978 RepID=UPI0025FF894B|nr:hypothetical protein [Ruminococcus sp.]MBQ8967139.1 hypothetical protein [Ruminococcus sp.]